MIKIKITRVDCNNYNTPILYKHEIEEYAYNVLADYKPNLLKEPGAVGFEHFLEKYLGLELFFRDIYNDNPENPIFGVTNFDRCVVKVFDKENNRIKNELMPPDSVVIDNYVMKSGREGMANFTGVHEGGHYLIHSGVSFPERTRKILCRRANIEGSRAGNAEEKRNTWLEFQANHFTASFTMPNATFVPFVNEFLREHGIYKRCVVLGANEDLDIFAKDLLPEYVAEVYGVSKRAAFNKLKSNSFVEI